MSQFKHFPTQTNRTRPSVASVLFLSVIGLAVTQEVNCALNANEPPKTQNQDEKKFMNTITGEFEVKITPAETGEPQLGMMLLDKKYSGDLDAIGKGRMLTGMTSIKDSAGYVAMERIEGTIKGRRGTFVIQHSGTMARGKPTLLIHVVPDSGTGDLSGLEGTMDIRIVDRKHFYDLRYSLPELESKSK